MKRLTLISILLLPALLLASDLRLTVLDNGLTLYTKEDHSKPLISLVAIVDGSSRTETPDIAGLSHFYEHLIARGGSAKQTETEFRRQMSSLGEENIYTYDDGTQYGFTVPTENFPETIWRFADFLMDLKPDTLSIAKERTIVMEEYNMSVADNPNGRLWEQMAKLAFTEHPYYPTTIGLPEVIRKATYDQLKTFYQERYVPNQIVMTVVGDFQTEDMICWIRENFDHYQPGKISFEQNVAEPEQTTFRQVADSMEVSSSYVLLGYHIPPLVSADMPALKVMAHILGGSSHSRLDRALKMDENLVLGVWCYPDFLRDASLLYVGMQCEPDKEAAAVSKTFGVIQRLASEGVTEAELQAAREKLIADDVMANSTFKGQAENVSHFHVAKATFLAEQMPALIRSVTAEDVQRVARQYLDASRANLSLIEPFGKPLRNYQSVAMNYSLREPAGGIATVTKTSQFIELPNGLRALLKEDKSSPTICVTAFIKGGQWLEGPGKSGVGALTASLLDKGTEKYTREQLQARKDELGITLWNHASEDYLEVGFSGLADKLTEGLELIDQMLFHAQLSAEQFDLAKADQIQAVKAIEDQPWEYTHREVQQDLFKQSPYRNPVLGTEADVQKLTRQEVLDYYQKALASANLFVVMVGDFQAAEVSKWIESKWGILPKRPAPKIKFVKDKPVGSVKVRQVYKEKDQNTFNYTWLTVPANHPDFLPLVLAKRMLSTRLFYKWIYDKGIAYRMWTRMFPHLGQTRFYFEMGVSDANFPTARAGILADLKGFLAKPITKEELEKAKQDEITRHLMTQQTNQGVVEGLGSWEMVGVGHSFYQTFPDRVKAVSARDVERVAKKYLNPERYVLVNVGPAKVE